MRTPLLLTAFLSLLSGAALAQTVVLTGISGNRALLVIDGAAPRFLSAGQSHQGVKLLSMQGERAVMEINGQRQTLQVGDAPVSVGKAVGSGGAQRIVLTADSQGHFMPAGQINGRAVRFMVDTGATLVILGAPDATRLQLAHEQGQTVRVNTANGMAIGHQVRLDAVRVGDVQVHGVPAIVLPQAMPYVLLGNSFLTRFQMQRTNDQLMLDRRY